MPFSSPPIPGQGGPSHQHYQHHPQQPLSIPTSSSPSPNNSYGQPQGHTGTSFPRQTSFAGPSHQQGGPSRWDGNQDGHMPNGSSNGSASGSGGGMVSGLSALMRSRGGNVNDMEMNSSPPGYANSSLSSNPHSGFHPSSYGPNMPFSALALGMSQHGTNSYMNSNMGMSISPPHWGSLGSGSFVGSMGNFGTSLNSRERELEASYVRDFNCCGRKLNGLHALLEHYEEEHANLAPDVRIAAINAAQNSMNPNSNHAPIPSRNPSNPFIGNGQIPPTPTSMGHGHHQSDVPAPPGMMDIEMDEPTQYPATAHQLGQHQQPHFNHRPPGQNGMPSNPWAAAFRPQLGNPSQPQCVPPSLLSYAPPTPGSQMNAVLTPEQLQAKALRKAQKKAERAAREEASADDPEGDKRFPCPIEGCGKVYKQANGLKYHLTRSINSGHGNVAALGGLAAILGESHDSL
ncbi:uncharacterized protein IL334_004138 [Kwoniella shivajii]|uniref:C2H2-type domain-containing protein n=1 Tax=Kwoniella shivajii TaxID=564305 RepID=A0ABZ1D0S5_9TREE|nr:hypothetical protein IL334_004138 [Kwoniella shivajii]